MYVTMQTNTMSRLKLELVGHAHLFAHASALAL